MPPDVHENYDPPADRHRYDPDVCGDWCQGCDHDLPTDTGYRADDEWLNRNKGGFTLGPDGKVQVPPEMLRGGPPVVHAGRVTGDPHVEGDRTVVPTDRGRLFVQRPNLGHVPPEPPIGTVLHFRVRFPGGGQVYDYAAIRAGDGKWYATGGETRQGVAWEVLVAAVRDRIAGPMTVMQPSRSVFL